MIKIAILLNNESTIYARSSVSNLTELSEETVEVGDANCLRLEGPARGAQLTGPVQNEKGQVKLKDGSWASAADVNSGKVDPRMLHITIKGGDIVAFDSDEMLLHTQDIANIRYMNKAEKDMYTAAVDRAKLMNSNLSIGKQTPKIIEG